MSTKTVEKKDSYYRDVLRKFTAHKLAMIGVVIIALEVFLVIFLPMIMSWIRIRPIFSHSAQSRVRDTF